MTTYHVAEINVARALEPLDSERLADFVAWLDRINAVADRAPGFVWRLQDAGGNATSIRASDDPLVIVNLSVWESIEALADFTYRSEHRSVFARRFDWFGRFGAPYLALWWVPAGHRPTVDEGLAALGRLAERGPAPDAFTLMERFPAPTTPTIAAIALPHSG